MANIYKTRTRIFIPGYPDVDWIIKETKDWAYKKRIFLHVHQSKSKEQTIIMVRPFERIHKPESFVVAGEEYPLHVHKILLYGDIPNSEGKAMSIPELTHEICMPAKDEVLKTVAFTISPGVSETTGGAKWLISFYPSTNLFAPAENLAPEQVEEATIAYMEENARLMKNAVGDRIMDIIDSGAADSMDYMSRLDEVRERILVLLGSS